MSPRKRGNAENVISPRYCCCTPQGSRTRDDDRLRLVGSEILSQNPQVKINQCSSFIWDSLCLSPTALKMASAAEHNTHMGMMRVVVRYIVTSLLLSHISLQGGGRLYRWEQSNLHQMSTPSCPFLLTLSGQLTGGQRIRVCAGSESS